MLAHPCIHTRSLSHTQDFVVENATLSDITESEEEAGVFTAKLVPNKPGPYSVSVTLPQGKVKALAAKEETLWNSASSAFQFMYDRCYECVPEARESCVLNLTTDDTSCTCKRGYDGLPKEQCFECPGGASNPCSGHGRCTALGGLIQCFCEPLWNGVDCAINLGVLAPSNVTAEFVNFHNIRVSWDLFENNTNVEKFRVKFSTPKDGQTKIDLPSNTSSVLLSGLSELQQYTISVCSLTPIDDKGNLGEGTEFRQKTKKKKKN